MVLRGRLRPSCEGGRVAVSNEGTTAMMGIWRKMTLTLVIVGLAAAYGGRAAAGPVIYNTGVNDFGHPLSGGSVDPHWAASGGNTDPVATVIGNPGGVGWIGNTSSSTWISGDPSTFEGGGPVTFTQQFNLTASQAASLTLTGMWSTDDQATMLLNGNLVASSPPTGDSPWGFFAPFSVTSGFQAGLNTIEVVDPNNIVTSNDGPGGIQIQFSPAVAPTPEPSTFALAGLGGLGLALYGWRRRRGTSA
jgi:hypothetical protein